MATTTLIKAPRTTTSSHAAEPSKLRFLDLPWEIRSDIYHHLFDGAKLSCDTPHSTWPSCGYSICSCLFPWDISQTCRQLREESLPPLMTAMTVEVAGTFEKVSSISQRYLTAITKAVVLDVKQFSLRPYHLEKLSGLKVLELRNITVWCKFYDEVFLNSPEADEAMHDMALFNLKRIGANLIELCRKVRPFQIHLCCQYVINSLNDETIVSIPNTVRESANKFKHATINVDEKTVIHKNSGPPMKNFNSWSGYF